MINLLEPFNRIKAFFFDVDGVFTNSRLTVLEDGSLLRTMNVRDGYAVKMAVRAGYSVIVITGGTSIGVVKRLRGLGVTEVFSGVEDKKSAYREALAKYGIKDEEVLYMGDDLPDWEVMRRVALPCCPADAEPDILRIADYVSPRKGGDGCVRDVIEKVMRLQKTWPTTNT